MPSKTETHIKEVAKRIFFKEGRFDARLHEIATSAKVNKALLHYYFRDRERLLQAVYEEALEASFLRMFALLTEKKPFEEKVGNAVSHMTDYLGEFPFIETFIISQVNATGAGNKDPLPIKAARDFTRQFLPEIRQYLKKNKVKNVTPEAFLVNMMALCAYPAATKPVIKGIFRFSEKDFTAFLNARKKLITEMVLMRV